MITLDEAVKWLDSTDDYAWPVVKLEVERLQRELAEKSEQVQRLQRWFSLLEASPGETKEVIRERCLSTVYIQPIISGWREDNERLREALTDAWNTYHYDMGHSGSVDDCRRGQCEEMYEALHPSPSQPENNK